MQNHGKRTADPFSLMRIDISFELDNHYVQLVEDALHAYVQHPEVQTEILACGYQNGQFELQLCYFSTDGKYRNELAWLHKTVQKVVVPVPVFTVQIRKD